MEFYIQMQCQFKCLTSQVSIKEKKSIFVLILNQLFDYLCCRLFRGLRLKIGDLDLRQPHSHNETLKYRTVK